MNRRSKTRYRFALRLGLKPILRRVYVPSIGNPNRQCKLAMFSWLWLYAFVHPQTGETKAWILPYVNTELFNRVLADFAHEFDNGTKKHILLAVDQAGWHISQDARSSSYDYI